MKFKKGGAKMAPDKNNVSTNESELILGSAEWFSDLQHRAESIGNELMHHCDVQDIGDSKWIYYRYRTRTKSPFSRRNIYAKRALVSCGGAAISFWSDSPWREEFALELQKQIEYDERIYAKWLELGQPSISKHLITIREIKADMDAVQSS